MWPRLILMPVVGGAIGWFTNYLAIRMLFRPREPWRLWRWTVQGVIPQRRDELAHRVADAIERDLFSHDDIRQAVLHPEYQDALRERLEGHVRDYLGQKFDAMPKVVRTLIGSRFVDKLARSITDDVMGYVPDLIDGAAHDLEARFDIRAVICSKIDAFDLGRLEALVLEIAHRELRFIEILGGIVGAIVGVVFAVLEHLLG